MKLGRFGPGPKPYGPYARGSRLTYHNTISLYTVFYSKSDGLLGMVRDYVRSIQNGKCIISMQL